MCYNKVCICNAVKRSDSGFAAGYNSDMQMFGELDNVGPFYTEQGTFAFRVVYIIADTFSRSCYFFWLSERFVEIIFFMGGLVFSFCVKLW